MKDSFKEKNSIFERNPKITIICTVLIFSLILDFLLTNAIQLIEKDEIKIRVKHPVYHHTFKKNSKSTEPYRGNKYTFFGGHKITIFTNSLGFKGKSIREVPLKSDNHRILFIGDSFTEGVSLDYEDTFVGFIDLALQKKQIEVLNAGRGSYSPIVYWRKIKHLIEDVGLKFNEVVAYIDISDPQNEVAYELSKDNNIVIPNSRPNFSFSNKIKKFISENFTFIYHTLNLMYDSLPFEGGKWRKVIHPSYIMDKWTVDENAYNSFGKEGVESMKKYMDRLLNLLRKNKINLTIAVYPWPTQIWRDDLNSIHVDIWKAWAKENNVLFLNYFPDFIKTGSSKTDKLQILNKYYIPGDVHFNKEGSKLIADKFIKTFFN